MLQTFVDFGGAGRANTAPTDKEGFFWMDR